MKRNEDLLHSTLEEHDNEQVRKFMSRPLRRVISGLLLVVLLVSIFISLAAFQPFIVTMTTPIFAYRQNITSDYQVNLTPDAPFAQRTLPAGGAYVQDYTESVTVDFNLEQRALHLGSLSSRNQADAILQVHAPNDPSVLLMEQHENLLPVSESAATFFRQDLNSSATVMLAAYRQAAADFLSKSKHEGEARLIIRLNAEMAGSILGQNGTSTQTAEVVIPLLTESFRIQNNPVSVQRLVTLPVSYLVQPALLPAFVYPLLSSVLLLSLVLFLVLTANRPDTYFRRGLKQLLRQGRRQILMIADKAWEPDWCITVADFDSMIQTARRLRHPIFCYVDYESETPAAYFYVYYGENNYCYVYDGKPPRKPGRQRVPAFGLLKAPESEQLKDLRLTAEKRALAEPEFSKIAADDIKSDSPSGAAGSNIHTQPISVQAAADTSAGPKMPSPDPFLDLINDPWPHISPAADAKSTPEHSKPVQPEAKLPANEPDQQNEASWHGTDEANFRKTLF